MASTWWYEQRKLLIALWNEGLDLSSILKSYPWFSSPLKHTMVMMIIMAATPIVFEFSQM